MRIAWLLMLAVGVGACGDSGGKVDRDSTARDEVESPDGAGAADGLDGADGADGVDGVDGSEEASGPTRIETLLDREVSMFMGYSPDVAFEVPSGTLAVTVTVLGEEAHQYVLERWAGPDASTLVTPKWLNGSDGQTGLCVSCNNRVSISETVFAALAPNNPSAEVKPGTHTIAVFGVKPPKTGSGRGTCGNDICEGNETSSCTRDCRSFPATKPVRVVVHAKVANAAPAVLPATGVLDLNLHFTGAQGLTAASAPTNAEFQAALDTMRTIYGSVGITLGELTYRDVDERFRVIESIDGEGNDLEELFASSAGDPRALNLYFVDTLASGAMGGFGVILGISGGIPGPPLLQGTRRSGVAIAVKPIPGAPASWATTMAHETGHFLGLFHTSEQAFFGPQVHDPLPDTPENDQSYLMFNTGSGNKLSASQGEVMRRNPWVRHHDDSGEAQ